MPPTASRLISPSSASHNAQLPAPPALIPASALAQADNVLLSLRTHGFVILTDAISPTQLSKLRQHARNALALAQDGHWPYLRTLPKQFPPWSSNPRDGIWGLQHLLHPEMPGRDAFAEVYFGDEVIEPVRVILEAELGEEGDERLVLELFNMLVAPPRDFELRWHRDAIAFDGLSKDKERELMGLSAGAQKLKKATHAQYNVPLLYDESLHVIPGSHLRSRTESEEELLAKDTCASELPDMMIVALQPGDIVFYDSNIIHRGVYRAGIERLTLHGSVGEVGASLSGGRALQVLQHGVGDWMAKCDFSGIKDDRLRLRAEAMKKRLLDLGLSHDQVNSFVHKD